MLQANSASSPVLLRETFGQLLFRGLMAGLLAGLLSGGVAYLIGEQYIDQAITIEKSAAVEHGGGAHSHDDASPLVSREGQKVGLIVANALVGLALGSILATVLNIVRRVTLLPGSALVMVTTCCGWLAIGLVPFFKYPANPPAVGDPETVTHRTLLWFGTVFLGLSAIGIALLVHSKTKKIVGRMIGLTLFGGSFLAVVFLGYVLLPGINEVPEDFPAVLLWKFRISALATQAILWVSLGCIFACATERFSRR
ncbi:MAG: CbtA family protein [Mycobacteriaceae bacterium]